MAEAIVLEPDVMRAASGDRQAFGRLIDATRTTVCSIALAVVRDVEASEDVAQDVYLHAWRSLPSLRNSSSFLPWLRQLARNRAHAFLRQDKPARRTRMDESIEAVLVDQRPGPDVDLLVQAERASIREALDELNADAREVLILFYREEQSIRQVAKLLDLSEAAVKKRLERARYALKEAIDRGLSEAFERSKPGAAFSFAVLAMLPPLAPAAAMATKSALGFLGVSKLASVLGSALMASLFGVAGVLCGYYQLHKNARDSRERRQLVGLSVIGTAMILLVVAAMQITESGRSGAVAQVAWFLALVGTLALQQYVLIPRVIGRRLQMEQIEDPQAKERQARDFRRCNLFFALGVALGGAAVLWSILHPK